MAWLNTEQNAIILVLTIISSSLSITGSSLILRFIRGNYKAAVKAQRSAGGRGAGSAFTPTYLRIMIAMSCFDILYSINLVFQPLGVDSTSEYSREYDNLTFGNKASCSALGAISQLCIAGFIYYGMLSFYYLFTVRWGKSQRWVAQRAEPWMHVIAIGFPVVTSITGLIIDCYSYLDLVMACWVANYPKGCQYKSSPVDCSSIPGYIFGGVPFFFLIPALSVNNFLVYRHVRKVYMRAGTSAFQISKQSGAIVSSIDERQKKRIQEVATQTTLYVVVAFFTYMPLIINELVLTVILNYYARWQSQFFGWMCATAILSSLAGFWNAVIFFRPQYRRLREKDIGVFQAIKMVIRNEKSKTDTEVRVVPARNRNRNPYANTRPGAASVANRNPPNTVAPVAPPAISDAKSSSAAQSDVLSQEAIGSVMPDLDDDMSEVAAETIPALIIARLSAGNTSNEPEDEDSDGEQEQTDDKSGSAKQNINSGDADGESTGAVEAKTLTQDAFETTVKFPGESQYTVPSTHNA